MTAECQASKNLKEIKNILNFIGSAAMLMQLDNGLEMALVVNKVKK